MLFPYDDKLERDMARSQPAQFLASIVNHSDISHCGRHAYTCFSTQAISTAPGGCGDYRTIFMLIFLNFSLFIQ